MLEYIKDAVCVIAIFGTLYVGLMIGHGLGY